MVQIRKFNQAGIKRIHDIISDHKSGKHVLKNLAGLAKITSDTSLTEPLTFKKSINENKKFAERFEFSKYLHDLLKDELANQPVLIKDIGFWTWLTIFYIEQFAEHDSKIYLSNDIETYILSFEKSPFELSYRHIAFSCFKAYDAFGDDMKFFCGPRPRIYGKTGGEFWEQCNSGPLFYENKNLFNLCHDIYTDPITGYAKKDTATQYKYENGSWKKNTRGSLKGHYQGTAAIRRFVEVFKRIQKTHRFQKMTSRQIENLLTNEFTLI